ncbi:MAG: hypothetical protein JO270_13190 [Acidobacteriaceae bacterium]|nr:hypothetical protein [Acidobacteriaceae bacterium]
MIGTALLYVVARLEVSWALLTRRIQPRRQCEDTLSPELVPSIAAGDRNDRDLAEIDQDGFLFAMDERDRALFDGRSRMVPRRHHRLQIIFSGGVVRLRKGRARQQRDDLRGRLLEVLRFDFYLEAAALLRLRGFASIPPIRRINCNEGTIEMDFIWGRDLRHILADCANSIDYTEISRRFFRLILDTQSSTSRQVIPLVAGAIERGVVQRDLTPANFICGYRSQQLYMVDFSLVYLRPVPGWRTHARRLSDLLTQSHTVTKT